MVFPLILDIIVGPPSYNLGTSQFNFIGFIMSHKDITTEIIYCIFVLFTTFFLFLFGKKKYLYLKEIKSYGKNITSFPVKLFLSLVVFTPVILAFKKMLAGNVSLNNILNYNYLRLLFRGDLDFIYYYYIALLCVLSFIILLLISNSNLFYISLIYAFPLYVAIGIHGKRNIIAILIFMYVFAILFKMKISTRYFKYIIAFFLLILIISSVKYQSNVRNIEFKSNMDKAYTDFRVDYGRDDVVKMAIYYEINEDPILENQKNSQLYFLKYFPGEINYFRTEYKYSVYATSKLLGYATPIDLGWGMTTGIFDESIANYGIIFGVLLSNLLLVSFCRLSDKTNNSLVILLAYITGLLLLVLQLTSFIFIFILWLILIFIFFFKYLLNNIKGSM